MIEKITRAYVGKLVEHGVISNNDADVYMYGFYQTVMFLVNIITTTFIAVLLIAGLLGTSRIFLKRHTPMQVYAGFSLGFMCTFVASMMSYIYLFI